MEAITITRNSIRTEGVMTEQEFLRRIRVLSEHLVDDYYDGKEIDGDVKAIELLCHNFIEIKKMRSEDKRNGNIEGNKI